MDISLDRRLPAGRGPRSGRARLYGYFSFDACELNCVENLFTENKRDIDRCAKRSLRSHLALHHANGHATGNVDRGQQHKSWLRAWGHFITVAFQGACTRTSRVSSLCRIERSSCREHGLGQTSARLSRTAIRDQWVA